MRNFFVRDGNSIKRIDLDKNIYEIMILVNLDSNKNETNNVVTWWLEILPLFILPILLIPSIDDQENEASKNTKNMCMGDEDRYK